jgi:hypothetical protein
MPSQFFSDSESNHLRNRVHIPGLRNNQLTGPRALKQLNKIKDDGDANKA